MEEGREVREGGETFLILHTCGHTLTRSHTCCHTHAAHLRGNGVSDVGSEPESGGGGVRGSSQQQLLH